MVYDNNKYLIFTIDGEDFGIPADAFRGMVGWMPMEPIDGAPSYVKGAIEIGGRKVPTVDLRARFGLETVPPSGFSTIVLVDSETGVAGVEGHDMVGLLVDSVSEVVEITWKNKPEAEGFSGIWRARGVSAVGRVGGEDKFLLDVDALLTGKAVSCLEVA